MGDGNFLSADGNVVEDNWSSYLDKIKAANYLDPNEPNGLKIDSSSGTTVYKCTSPQFFGYQFTSTADFVDFIPRSTSSQQSSPAPDPVLADSKNGVVMGLDPGTQTANGPTLSQVLSNFGISTSNLNSTLQKILGVLGDATVMSVVTDRSNTDGIPTRNGFWIFPTDGTTLEIATKLTFTLSKVDIQTELNNNSFTSAIATDLRNDFGISIPTSVQSFTFPTDPTDDLLFIFTSVITATPDVLPNKYSLLVKLPNIQGFNIYIGQNNIGGTDSKTLALTEWRGEDQGSSGAKTSIASVGQTFDPSATDTSDAIPKWDGQPFFNDFHLWHVILERPTGGSISWNIALLVNIPISQGIVPIFLMFDTGNNTKTFNGGLLVTSSLQNTAVFPNDAQFLLPTFQDYRSIPLNYLSNGVVPDYIDLAQVFGGDVSFPGALPTRMTAGSMTYSQDSDNNHLEIQFKLNHGPSQSSHPKTIPAPFTWDQAKFHLLKDTKTKVDTMEITSQFQLAGGHLDFSLVYNRSDTKWYVTADATEINFGALVQFFDPGATSSMTSVLGKLTLQSLHIAYVYEKDRKTQNMAGSSFVFAGVVRIADTLLLDMFYQYTSDSSGQTPHDLLEGLKQLNPPINYPVSLKVPTFDTGESSAWKLDFFVNTVKGGATVAQVLYGIASITDIPGFIGDLKLEKDQNGTQPVLSLQAAKQKFSDTEHAVTFYFDISISFMEFTFAQVAIEGGTSATSPSATSPFRILRFSVGPLPLFNTLPVIKELPQPYQSLNYYYIAGPTDPDNNTSIDISNTLFKWLNDNLFRDSKLYCKAATTDDSGTALKLGSHFVVVNNDSCVLDHLFNAPDSPSITTTQTPQPDGQSPQKAVVRKPFIRDTAPDETDNTPTKGMVKKDTPFISISGMALQYKQQTLWLFMDATITLGPIEMDLIGFGIGLMLGPGHVNLSHPQGLNFDHDIAFQLKGLAMDLDQPPVLIAGVFEHEVTETLDAYRGGIAVGFDPYDFVAVGEYAEVTEMLPNKDTYKSIFVYAKLDGPLVDLEIAIIKGVRLGFGYNSFVRSPTVQELPDFPLINDVGISGAGDNPMKILQAMRGGDNPWVQCKHDSLWFAFGFSVSCFDIITATAVALLEFSDKGVIVNIFADVIGSMPPDAKSHDECIVYIELLMNAELNFIDDYFFVQAALAPTSFLLVPQCNLFGGFAMGTWFGNSQYAGDWVFSVGGYHPQFQAPAYYPKPDRLGIQFKIGDNMTIRGTGYFAICPKAVMGGAMIFILVSVGPVSAHLDAGFDALIVFHPLHYMFDCYVDVGVSCHVHFLFVSFDVNIDIGANLHIEGPEFGGVAHVDFWFFGFDVYFGASPNQPDPLHLKNFYEDVLMKAGPDGGSTPSGDITTKNYETLLKMTMEDGAFPAAPTTPTGTNPPPTPPPEGGVGATWRVRAANFQFRISTVFALKTVLIATKDDWSESASVVADPTAHASVDCVPTKAPNIPQSELKVRIYKESAKKTDDTRVPLNWRPQFVVKQVPIALWGDPDHFDPRTSALSGGDATVPLQMALSIKAPPATLSKSHIPPVDASQIARENVFGQDANHNDINPVMAPTERQQRLFPSQIQNPKDKLSDQWNKFQTTWQTSNSGDNMDIAKDLAAAFTSFLGWNNPPPDVVTRNNDSAIKPWDLTTRFPNRLVTGTGNPDVADGLANTYLGLPRVMAVS